MPGDYSDLIGKQFDNFNKNLEDNSQASPIQKWFAEVQAGRITAAQGALLARHEMENPQQPAAPAAPTPAFSPADAMSGKSPAAGLAAPPPAPAQAAPAPARPAMRPPPLNTDNMTRKQFNEAAPLLQSMVPKGETPEDKFRLQAAKDEAALRRAQLEAETKVKTTGMQTTSAGEIAGGRNTTAQGIASGNNETAIAVANIQAAARRYAADQAQGTSTKEGSIAYLRVLQGGINMLSGALNPPEGTAETIAALKAEVEKVQAKIQQEQGLAPTQPRPPAPPAAPVQQPGIVDRALKFFGGDSGGAKPAPQAAPPPTPPAPERTYNVRRLSDGKVVAIPESKMDKYTNDPNYEIVGG